MDTTPSRSTAAPCFARPSTGYFHPEGRCECFFGGPPPEFAPPPAFVAA